MDSSYTYVNGQPFVLADPLGLYGWDDFKRDVGDALRGGGRAVGDTAASITPYTNPFTGAYYSLKNLRSVYETYKNEGLLEAFNQHFNPAYAFLVSQYMCRNAGTANDRGYGCVSAARDLALLLGTGYGACRVLPISKGVPDGPIIGPNSAAQSAVPRLGGPLWSEGKSGRVANAHRHYKDHGMEFRANNALDYVLKAHEFLHRPPRGTLTRVRQNGDIVRYDPNTNTIGVMTKEGAPRTFFKPDPAKHGLASNLDYFRAQ